MKIQVLQEDINEGERDSCRDCPIALAIKRVVRDDLRPCVRVFQHKIIIYDKGFETDLAIIKFIHEFDNTYKIDRSMHKPFDFELDIPQEYLK